MPAATIQPKVSPSVIAWARATSGLSPAEAARRLGVDDSRLLRWEAGDETPTIPKLEELAGAYHRPLAVFLLPAPPKEAPAPPDLRVVGSASGGVVFSERTLLAIRRARRVQQLALQLDPEHDSRRLARFQRQLADLSPHLSAARFASETAAYEGSPPRFENAYKALAHWRRIVEAVGVLVLQLPMPVEDARGFTLSDSKWPVLVVNQSDTPKARNFTLFHEMGHLLQRKEGVCDLGGSAPEAKVLPVESWCNAFSGAFLVPDTDFLEELRSWPKGEEPPEDEIRRLSNRYQVSETAILRRLLSCGIISTAQYRAGAQRRTGPGRRATPARSQEMKRNIPAERVAEFGSPFINLVLKGASAGQLALGEVADILDIRVKHLGAITDRVAQSPAET